MGCRDIAAIVVSFEYFWSWSCGYWHVILHDVIDIDKDGDSGDVVFIDETFDANKKGKAIKDVFDGHDDNQAKEPLPNYFFAASGAENLDPVNGIECLESFSPVSHNVINLDGHSSDLSYDDNNDVYFDDFMDFDEYAFVQAHFDNMDIPPGIEAPIPWLPDFPQAKKKADIASSSHCKGSEIHLNSVGPHGIDSSMSSRSAKPAYVDLTPSSVGSSGMQTQMDTVINHPEMDPSSPWNHSRAAQSKNKSSAPKHRGNALNLPLGKESSKSRWFLEPFKSKKKPVASNNSTIISYVNQLDLMESSSWGHYTPEKVKKQVSTSSTYNPPFPVHADPSSYPTGVEPSMPWWQESFKTKMMKQAFASHPTQSAFYVPFPGLHGPSEEVADIPWVHDPFPNKYHVAAEGSSTFPVEAISGRDKDEILRNFQSFKQFDTVEDHSDHHFTVHGSYMKQPPKNWAKRIQEEWKILEKDLPGTIFVRVYETRMELLRAVIIGAEGTPYHDGLFFFDVFFPSDYPNVPPHVYYHSGGLRLNPNLYNCGKVCLSLLNTWSGNKNEKWIPGVSTILQVLVSIQGLILNTKPYFNEPGYAHMSGSASGEMRSQQYNEDTFILSLKTMMYTMRRPPKHFEDFVLGHFCNRAHDILVACKAYMDGAQVGCLVKGGVQDVDVSDKSCSKRFKHSLAAYVDMLVKAFTQIGAENCEKFLSAATNGNKRSSHTPNAATGTLSS
ncbi:putative ubiquitin-conjugating enzyme E2 26 [Morella rubra]|uniref:E2 ubiquitin-conjugating enzyme n=1 Tax=Morella rubra TaxID=262757 RepID=A0A6A1URU4_9ROSI|nr:putative ubiquitin-conjugating enzyme E2 26 [Morella rubra]